MSSSETGPFRRRRGFDVGEARRVQIPTVFIENEPDFAGAVEGDCTAGELIVRDGRVVGMKPSSQRFDRTDLLVTPPLVEAHCHLDKAFTASRLGFVGGSLREAIDAQERDVANWTVDDLRTRGTRALMELETAGCALARTHVNWTIDQADPARPPLAWEVLGELAEEWRGRVELQRAALLSPEDLADDSVVDTVAARIARDGGVLGGFVFDHVDRAQPIRRLVAAANRHGLSLDFHVDEGLDPGLDGVELICDAVAELGYEGPVLCGHVCSLAALEGDRLARRIERIASTGLSVVALPASNLYLQDRGRGTPRRRGITRIRELSEAGVNVAVGTDNVQDAFNPVGMHDPVRSLGLAVLTAHLDPPLGRWLPLITTNARLALVGKSRSLKGLLLDDLVSWEVPDTAALLSL